MSGVYGVHAQTNYADISWLWIGNTLGMHGVAVDLHKAHTYILYDWGSSKDAYCMHLYKSGIPWAVLTHSGYYA